MNNEDLSSIIEKKKAKKKYIVISILLVIIVGLAQFIYNSFVLDDYTRAKRQSERFLNKNISELQQKSKTLLHSKSSKTKEYKGKSYSYKTEENNGAIKRYIEFEIDAQGMLGGQYWGIIYSSNDDLLDGNTVHVYDEKEMTGKGNNIYIIQKIKDNWYFYYYDYDGRVDVNKILD